jgi:Flp pilus assembly pilin Flp
MRLPDYVSHILIEFLKEESGAPLIEYVLIASLAAAVCGLFLMAFNKDFQG